MRTSLNKYRMVWTDTAARNTAILLVVGYLVIFVFVSNWLISKPDHLPSPTILVVGDYDAPSGFGASVRDAVIVQHTSMGNRRMAYRTLNTSAYLADDGSVRDEGGLQRSLLRMFATEHVYAIVDASTTHVAPTIVDTASVFDIPVLLTVATNTRILQPPRGNVFRLPANDLAQAEEIAKWVALSKSTAIVLYDDSAYGRALYSSVEDILSEDVESQTVVPFRIAQQTNVAQILETILSNTDGQDDQRATRGPDRIVFIGYEVRLVELITSLRFSGYSGELLVSDGCFTKALPYLSNMVVGSMSLSFPTKIEWGQAGGSGFGVFGGDAYVMLCNAYSTLVESKDSNRTLREAMQDFVKADQQKDEPLLKAIYRFDMNGENIIANFHIVNASKGLIR